MSYMTVLEGCRQFGRNIAPINSCVALVMIFQEVLRPECSEQSAETKSIHGKAAKQTMCAEHSQAWLHALLFITHPQHWPKSIPPL